MREHAEMRSGRGHLAAYVWAACIAALIGPSLIVWIVRGVAYATKCAPGPVACAGTSLGNVTLGTDLRYALELAWALPGDSMLLVGTAVLATLAAFFARRPLLGTLGLLVLPIAAVLLPTLAVYTAMYPGCEVNVDGIGNCMLWGTTMGMSFHTAASAPWIVYGFVPYSFALALMLGLLGWFFSQPRPARPHAHARMRRLDDR